MRIFIKCVTKIGLCLLSILQTKQKSSIKITYAYITITHSMEKVKKAVLTQTAKKFLVFYGT